MMSIIFTLIAIYFVYRLFFGSDSDEESERSSSNAYNSGRQSMTLEDSLVFIIACTMMADGAATQSELKAVKSFLVKNYNESDAKRILLSLRDCLKAVNFNQADIRPACIRINQQVSYQGRLAVLNMLFQISIADGQISDDEAELLQQFARFTRIRIVDFNHMQTYYTYGYQWKESNDNRGRNRQQQSNQQSTTSITKDRLWALKTLGLGSDADEKGIKKAYRQLALQYHPDRQVNASEDEMKKATEKFREIQEAYSILTK